jgi:hypothetical protein
MKNKIFKLWILTCCFALCALRFALPGYAEEIKQPNVNGRFYPADAEVLSRTIKRFLSEVEPPDVEGDILALISPHAGYEFSGRTAAHGYKIIKNRHYDTVIILGPSHYLRFKGAALWPKGALRTPLGDIPVDDVMAYGLLLSSSLFSSYPEAFAREHSIEVELPFLQIALDNLKIVPVVLGYVNFSECQNLAKAIGGAIKNKNCLLIASSDMYHGFDYQEGEIKDIYTLSLIRQLKAKKLYDSIQDDRAQLCGWTAVVISMLVAKQLGYEKVDVMDYTNSAEVMSRKQKGEYCVGYSSVVMYKQASEVSNSSQNNSNNAISSENSGGEDKMFNEKQKKELLEIARKSIEYYLSTDKRLELKPPGDSVFLEQNGAFVTLHKHNQLRGCIGNIIGKQPLYLTIRDMAVEAAVNDPRFPPVKAEELTDIEIEISVLSPLRKIDNPDMIELGKHGVLVKKGYQNGVFLPQVATETGWTKEEFLSNLCAHKAGLSPLAWKDDPSIEIYIFTAEVFSE